MRLETVNYERKERVAYITLNRPQSLNAISDQTEIDLATAFSQLDMDEDAWIGILYGAGRCFSAGGDVKERFIKSSSEERLRRVTANREPEGYLGHTRNWKPVIAAVHNYCLGAGFELALECDLIVATEDAQFGITEVKRGLSGARPWFKLHHFLPSKIATEMLLTGEPLSATELRGLGLINRVVPVGQQLKAAEELAQVILQSAPLAVRSGVRASRWPWMRTMTEANLNREPLRLFLSEDFEESSRALAEKRQPNFKGK